MEQLRACEDNPLRAILANWLQSNLKLPTDTTGLILFMLMAVIAWYIFNWIMKLILTVIWPIAIVFFVVLLLPHVQDGTFHKAIPELLNTLKQVVMKMGNLAKCASRCVR